MQSKEDLQKELVRRRNQIVGNIPGPTGNSAVRRLDDDEGNLVYNSPQIVPSQIQNKLDKQNLTLPFNEQTKVISQRYNAFNVVEVKKIESSLLKTKIKEWFDFCLSSEYSFKDTMLYYNIISKDQTFEMIYNVLEETAFVEIDNNIVSTKTKDVDDVLNQFIFTKNQLVSFYTKPMFVGEPVPFIKVSGYDEFMIGRKPESFQLAKRIVNGLNFLSSVPDEVLELGEEEIIAFLIKLNQQKSDGLTVDKSGNK